MNRRRLLIAVVVSTLVMIVKLPLATPAGEPPEACGHLYGLLRSDVYAIAHSGVPYDSLENKPSGDWLQDHEHDTERYEMWHDFHKPGWRETGTEWDHSECGAGGSE